MSDEELAAEIESRDGKAFVGLKAPGISASVDDRGHPRVSRSQVEAGVARLRDLGVEVLRVSDWIPAAVVWLLPEQVSQVRALEEVEYVEPVIRFTPLNAAGGIPSAGAITSGQDTTWNVHRVQAPAAWVSARGAGVKTLVIDEGAWPDHPDLNYSVVHACQDDPLDWGNHGTPVAGIIAALDNQIDVIGVAPDVELWSASIAGSEIPNADHVECAISFARQNNTFVVNMSVGANWWESSTALIDAINGAYWQSGLFLVAGGREIVPSG